MIRRKILLGISAFATGAYLGQGETPSSLQRKTEDQLPIGTNQRYWLGNTIKRVYWNVEDETINIELVDNPDGDGITISHVDDSAVDDALTELRASTGGGVREISWENLRARYGRQMNPWKIDVTALRLTEDGAFGLGVEVIQSHVVNVPEELQY